MQSLVKIQPKPELERLMLRCLTAFANPPPPTPRASTKYGHPQHVWWHFTGSLAYQVNSIWRHALAEDLAPRVGCDLWELELSVVGVHAVDLFPGGGS